MISFSWVPPDFMAARKNKLELKHSKMHKYYTIKEVVQSLRRSPHLRLWRIRHPGFACVSTTSIGQPWRLVHISHILCHSHELTSCTRGAGQGCMSLAICHVRRVSQRVMVTNCELPAFVWLKQRDRQASSNCLVSLSQRAGFLSIRLLQHINLSTLHNIKP